MGMTITQSTFFSSFKIYMVWRVVMLSVKLVTLINDGIGRRGVEDLFII